MSYVKKMLLFFCCSVVLMNCTPNKKIGYGTKDIERIKDERLSQIVFDIEELVDKRKEDLESEILYDNPRKCTIDIDDVCINAEKHYKKSPVARQVTSMLFERYNRTSYSGAHSQVVGGVSLSYKNVSFRLENDFFGDRHDRWRSNAFELTIGDFVFGSNLYNNEVNTEAFPDCDGKNYLGKTNREPFGAWRDGETYSSPAWVGFKHNGQVHRFGYSHPLVQDRTQNVIHKWFGPGRTNFFNNYDNFQYGTYNYYGYNNPYSLW